MVSTPAVSEEMPPPRGGKRWNLASLVNNQVLQESHSIQKGVPNPQFSRRPSRPKATNKAPTDLLAARVSGKLEEGDYRGGVRLACGKDVIAEHNRETLEALKEKYPPAHSCSLIADFGCSATLQFPINTQVILKAIASFPNGSGGGPDGLLPQHLKDLTGNSTGDGVFPFWHP